MFTLAPTVVSTPIPRPTVMRLFVDAHRAHSVKSSSRCHTACFDGSCTVSCVDQSAGKVDTGPRAGSHRHCLWSAGATIAPGAVPIPGATGAALWRSPELRRASRTRGEQSVTDLHEPTGRGLRDDSFGSHRKLACPRRQVRGLRALAGSRCLGSCFCCSHCNRGPYHSLARLADQRGLLGEAHPDAQKFGR